MPSVSPESALFAIRSIATHGDTDVFPFPIENRWFADEEGQVANLLAAIDANFDTWIAEYPVVFQKAQSAVGYNGFRAGSQIDPIWNAYLLSLVVQVANDIEAARLPIERNIVFSYRYKPDATESTMFDRDLGWAAFHRSALETAASCKFVLATDISDFYQRVYHHRLDNALRQATKNSTVATRIQALLFHLNEGTSYGLPIGGNAARILAELALNRIDRLLASKRIVFKRFVDDYLIFSDTRDEAQRALAVLSELLMTNEGLTLSRLKTRLMSQAEFRRSSPFADPAESSSEDEATSKRFLKLRLRYDPYSASAEDDYDELAAEVEKFDIIGMLANEFNKSRVDESVTRQLVKAIRFLEPEQKADAVRTLAGNIKSLYPIFPTVAQVLRRVAPDLDKSLTTDVCSSIRTLIQQQSYVVQPAANLLYAARVLEDDGSEETDAILTELFNRPGVGAMLRRDVILLMGRRRVDYWVSDVLKRWSSLGPWERRALLASSYILGDEGKHWRKRIKAQLNSVDQAFLAWVGERNNGQLWEIPL